MWFEIADGNRTFTFSFAAQQYTQNSQNSTPNSIFKKKCTIFVYFGIYLYFFSGFLLTSINIIGSDNQVFEGRPMAAVVAKKMAMTQKI